MQRDPVLTLGTFLVLVGISTLVAIGHCQDRPSAALLLARTCVSERGWDTATDDCAAIHAVALRRSQVRGIPLERAIVELSPRLHSDTPRPRAWLQHLSPDGRRPHGWRSASWERHRPLWMATLEEARALVAGERPSPCAAAPSSWGSHADVRTHLEANPELRWDEVSCGHTRNRFGRWLRRSR